MLGENSVNHLSIAALRSAAGAPEPAAAPDPPGAALLPLALLPLVPSAGCFLLHPPVDSSVAAAIATHHPDALRQRLLENGVLVCMVYPCPKRFMIV